MRDERESREREERWIRRARARVREREAETTAEEGCDHAPLASMA